MTNSLPTSTDLPRANTGESVDELSRRRPALVVFLRHSGCPFCREMLAQVARDRPRIEEAGTQIVLVHMMTEQNAAGFVRPFGLEDLPRISDPERKLYEAFALPRGTLSQVMGPRVWWNGLKATLSGHRPGVPSGDVMQLPGVFLVVDGTIVRGHRYETSADRVALADLAGCPVETGR